MVMSLVVTGNEIGDVGVEFVDMDPEEEMPAILIELEFGAGIRQRGIV